MKLEPPSYLHEDLTLVPTRKISGVFFLCAGNRLVSIGASRNILATVNALAGRKRKLWDRAYYLPKPAAELIRWRSYYRFKYSHMVIPEEVQDGRPRLALVA